MDTLIEIFSQLSKQKNEFSEQEGDAGAGASAGGSSGGSNTRTKWEDSYKTNRGPANMLGKKGEKWSTGLNRGPANQIW